MQHFWLLWGTFLFFSSIWRSVKIQFVLYFINILEYFNQFRLKASFRFDSQCKTERDWSVTLTELLNDIFIYSNATYALSHVYIYIHDAGFRIFFFHVALNFSWHFNLYILHLIHTIKSFFFALRSPVHCIYVVNFFPLITSGKKNCIWNCNKLPGIQVNNIRAIAINSWQV